MVWGKFKKKGGPGLGGGRIELVVKMKKKVGTGGAVGEGGGGGSEELKLL